jgi:hypothetical protein
VRNLLNLYGKIFSPSSLWLEGENVEKFRWPQQLLTSGDDNRFINYTERKQKVILLNSNKYSFEKGQMYVFRRRIATILEDEIDIYGEGWSNRTGSYFEFAKSFIRKVRTRTSSWSLNQRPIFVATDNVFGPVDSKSVMNQYRFSLIIENSLDYVSEKLFDAIQFGTVPIYVGPQLSEFGIPNEVAIQCEPSEVQVADKIASLRGDLTLAIDTLKAGRKFMTSFEAKEWSNSEVLISLADSIEAYLRDQLT